MKSPRSNRLASQYYFHLVSIFSPSSWSAHQHQRGLPNHHFPPSIHRHRYFFLDNFDNMHFWNAHSVLCHSALDSWPQKIKSRFMGQSNEHTGRNFSSGPLGVLQSKVVSISFHQPPRVNLSSPLNNGKVS